MPGTAVTRSGSRWPTHPTRPGAIATSSSQGRDAIVEFLTRKWARELSYRLRKELWSFSGNRISVRFEYESHDPSGQWWRSHGNEHWEFDDLGYMRRRDASINDYRIDERDRRIYVDRPSPYRP